MSQEFHLDYEEAHKCQDIIICKVFYEHVRYAHRKVMLLHLSQFGGILRLNTKTEGVVIYDIRRIGYFEK